MKSLARFLQRWLHSRDCACETTRKAAAFLAAVPSLRPRVHRDITSTVHTAAIYDDLERSEGWRDYISRVKEAREQLVSALVEGRFNAAANPAKLTYNEAQSALFALDLALGIPAAAAAAFEQWKAAEAMRLRAESRFDERAAASA